MMCLTDVICQEPLSKVPRARDVGRRGSVPPAQDWVECVSISGFVIDKKLTRQGRGLLAIRDRGFRIVSNGRERGLSSSRRRAQALIKLAKVCSMC